MMVAGGSAVFNAFAICLLGECGDPICPITGC